MSSKNGKPKGPPTRPSSELIALSGRLRLLADPTRMVILGALLSRDLIVSEMVALTGQTQPAVSHHLSLLRASGFVTPQREGKAVRYSLTGVGREFASFLGRLTGGGPAAEVGKLSGVKVPSGSELAKSLGGKRAQPRKAAKAKTPDPAVE